MGLALLIPLARARPGTTGHDGANRRINRFDPGWEVWKYPLLRSRIGAPSHRNISARQSKNGGKKTKKIARIGASSYRNISEAVVSNSNVAVSFRVFLVLPRAETFRRDRQKTEKKRQKSQKKQGFWRPLFLNQTMGQKIRATEKTNKTPTQNITIALFGHFRAEADETRKRDGHTPFRSRLGGRIPPDRVATTRRSYTSQIETGRSYISQIRAKSGG